MCIKRLTTYTINDRIIVWKTYIEELKQQYH